MTRTDAWRLGATLAITVAVAYAACTALFVIFPGPAMSFTTALFHGVDFSSVKTSPTSLYDFIYALVVMTVWAFVIGALFGWVGNLFQRGRG